MSRSAPTLRERLGGRWALSLRAYVVTAPLIIVAMTGASATSWGEVIPWTVAAVTALVVVGGWTYLLHRTVFRNRSSSPLPVAVVIGCAALAGFIFVIVASLVGNLLGLPLERSPWSRVIPTVLVATWWSVTLSLILEASDRFRRDRAILIERAVQQQVATLQEAEVAARIKDSIRDDINAELMGASTELIRQLDEIESRAGTSYTEVADGLRETAHRSVRPLSHRLAEHTAQDHPAPGFLTAVANIVRRQPFRPLANSIIYLVTTAPREFRRLTPEMAIASVTVTVALIVVTMTTFNAAMRRWPQHHAVLFISGIVVIEGLSVVLTPAYAAITGVAVTPADIVSSVVFGTLVIFVTSGFGSWRMTRQDMLRTFEQEITQDEVEAMARSRAIADAARAAGTLLHGAVQTKLIATAMAIDHGIAAGDMVAVNQALMQARAILEQPLPGEVEDTSIPLGAQIERKASLWRGLADITVTTDADAADIVGASASLAGEVVEEGIANALHHGRAQRISIRASLEGGEIRIEIIDDGVGPSAGAPGLGSRRLSEQAVEWSLKRTDEGTHLSVRVGLDPQATLVSAPELPPGATGR